ncbi:uncharacterized protein [Macrobrachium rosenbergii]|uniref:uncharacterized protein n=1 Tax=Macrobrachium rosenbergii TaxID=79674 RepID=UPI0034D4E4D5
MTVLTPLKNSRVLKLLGPPVSSPTSPDPHVTASSRPNSADLIPSPAPSGVPCSTPNSPAPVAPAPISCPPDSQAPADATP